MFCDSQKLYVTGKGMGRNEEEYKAGTEAVSRSLLSAKGKRWIRLWR